MTPLKPTRFKELLIILAQAQVEFVVIGGLAAIARGSARITQDVDVVYARSPENIARLAAAMEPLQPYLRGAPPGLPFKFDAKTIERGLNFTLDTTLGLIDFLGEVTGGGTYENLLGTADEVPVFDVRVKCVDLDTLIRLKRAAGRAKDLEVLAELESLKLHERRGDPT